MSAAVRFIILIPLGVLFGSFCATVMLLVLGASVPEFGATFVAAFIAAWNALFSAFFEANDPDAVARVGQRIWLLAMLVLVAPVAVAAIIAEAARLRGALLHVALTGALAVLLPLGAGLPVRAASAAEARVLACLFFTGAAGGLVCWLIAGLRREPAQPPVSQDG